MKIRLWNKNLKLVWQRTRYVYDLMNYSWSVRRRLAQEGLHHVGSGAEWWRAATVASSRYNFIWISFKIQALIRYVNGIIFCSTLCAVNDCVSVWQGPCFLLSTGRVSVSLRKCCHFAFTCSSKRFLRVQYSFIWLCPRPQLPNLRIKSKISDRRSLVLIFSMVSWNSTWRARHQFLNISCLQKPNYHLLLSIWHRWIKRTTHQSKYFS